jgi:mono/diheme cytochrome c family protein
MFQKTPLKTVVLALACLTMILFMFTIASARSDNQSNSNSTESRIKAGFAAAPVPLNLEGKNRALVGLGSYLVNLGGCADCHSAGPQTQFAPGGNPFFGQPEKWNSHTYLGGGRDFGPLIPGTASIISRNLTPDKSGLPIGGDSFEMFKHTIRTGQDPDHLHPNCAGPPNSGCLLPPFDGSLLQIMPWPAFQKLTDNDLRAIYEYLKAVPCVQGNYPGEPPNRCN